MLVILPLLTAFGLGSIVTAVVQGHLAFRSQQLERRFKEKQAAYIGLLEAYYQAALNGTDEAAKLFAYWQMRCELVASKAVRDAIARIVASNDDPVMRALADKDMKTAMRADLGVAP